MSAEPVTAKNASPMMLLLLLHGNGHRVRRRGMTLLVSNGRTLSPDLLDAIKRCKHELLRLVSPEDA